ncbi:PREDICTED: uncharacterized protein LOC109212639 [Nicotiana attenuata]|uniref:uncharacterized protein LOC109212639 n=1 Tax=Nicotiana attenuata TaxID=49451 RepID=UPI000905BE00|nr:PREDICTED: uncharacterized protein LOC109212639 [Nicotiana attenuata]
MEEMENENKALRDQMKEHQERVDKIPGAPKLLPKQYVGRFIEQPYNEEAAPHAIPKSFKMPPYLKIYDGTIDLEDHIIHYVTTVKGYDLSKEQVPSVLLKKFGKTLTGGALTWYSQLPARSIATFEEMADKFFTAHAGAKRGEARGPPKLPSPARTIHMIIGGGDDTSINHVKFTTTRKLKWSITHEWYDELEDSIIFDKSNTDGLSFPHYDALVIILRITDTDVERIMADDGSGVCIIHPRVLVQMRLEDKVIPHCITLTGFNNAFKRTSREVVLPVLARAVTLETTFHVMDQDTAYNAIIGRPWIHAM